MNDKLNCPNCGAVITGAKCEYCGTVFKQEKTQPVSFGVNVHEAVENFMRLFNAIDDKEG